VEIDDNAILFCLSVGGYEELKIRTSLKIKMRKKRKEGTKKVRSKRNKSQREKQLMIKRISHHFKLQTNFE
jgi:hypothetical protein